MIDVKSLKDVCPVAMHEQLTSESNKNMNAYVKYST